MIKHFSHFPTEKCSFIFRHFEMMEPARKRVLEEAAFQKHRKLTKKFKAHTRSLTSPFQGMVCGTQEEEGEGLLPQIIIIHIPPP